MDDLERHLLTRPQLAVASALLGASVAGFAAFVFARAGVAADPEPDRTAGPAAEHVASAAAYFAQGRFFEAGAESYHALQVDPGNPDAERLGFVSAEMIAIDALRQP